MEPEAVEAQEVLEGPVELAALVAQEDPAPRDPQALTVGQEGPEALVDPDLRDRLVQPAVPVAPVDQGEPAVLVARGVLAGLVRQAQQALPAARVAAAELEEAAVQAVLVARAAREELAGLEALVQQVRLDPQGSSGLEPGVQLQLTSPQTPSTSTDQATSASSLTPTSLPPTPPTGSSSHQLVEQAGPAVQALRDRLVQRGVPEALADRAALEARVVPGAQVGLVAPEVQAALEG